ncbi:MAG: Xaa-Pro peptidase family protein [Acidiferrobacterales bacterium]|nr:Xaa-Pro peptidase family protein [Acidiferrobacterales bacterium]
MTIPRETVFKEPEFETRLANTRQKMAARGIDTLILHSAPNIYYLCGHHTLNLWDYQCLIVPSNSPMVMLLWQFERGRFEASATLAELELYETHCDPIQATLEVITSRNLLQGRIGIEAQSRYLNPKMHDQLKDALNQANVVNGSGLVDSVRNIKSPAELSVMRKAAEITDLAIRSGFDRIDIGVTDSSIAARVASVLIDQHSLGFSVYPIISAGYRSGMPHNSNFGYRIQEGDPVFIECSPSHFWYHAPLMRTAVVGEANRQIEEFAELETEIVAAMLETAKAGALASDVAAVAASRIAPIRDQILFHEVYGYPVGIGFPPTWGEESGFAIVPSNHRPLKAGMVFHIPMTLRVNGEFGVGLSETFVVSEEGPPKTLSDLPLALHRVNP